MADFNVTGEGDTISGNAVEPNTDIKPTLDIPDKYVGMFSVDGTAPTTETKPLEEAFSNTDTGSELTVDVDKELGGDINVATTDELESNVTEVSVPTTSEPSTVLSYTPTTVEKEEPVTGEIVDPQEVERKAELDKAEQELAAQREDVFEAFTELGDMSGFIAEAEEDAQLQQRREELTEITNKIRRKEHEFRRNIEALEDKAGLTKAQTNALIADVDRKQSREIADLEIIAMARQGRYNDAAAIVDRKVEIEMQARANKLEGLKFLYLENKERFTKLEQRDFERTILAEERAYQEEYDKRKEFETLKLQMTINATEAGAGIAELEAIQNATDSNALFSVPNASRYMKTKAQILDEQLKQAQIASIWDSLNASDEGTVEINGVTYTEEDLISAELKADKAREVYAQILKMKDMEGKGGAIGFSWQKLIKYGDEPFKGTAASGYAAEAQRLIAMLSEQNLGRLKGSMSDNDLKFIQKISTSLDMNASENAWDAEMQRLEGEAINGYQESASILGLPPLDADPVDQADAVAEELHKLLQNGEAIYSPAL